MKGNCSRRILRGGRHGDRGCEMEILAAGEWRNFPMAAPYNRSCHATINLATWTFSLTKTGNHLRLEWTSDTGRASARSFARSRSNETTLVHSTRVGAFSRVSLDRVPGLYRRIRRPARHRIRDVFYVCLGYRRRCVTRRLTSYPRFHTGERWRADIRSATGKITVETTPQGERLRIPRGTDGIITTSMPAKSAAKSFHRIFRNCCLSKVKVSQM